MKVMEVEKKHYELAFDDAANPGCGYSFPCDKDGNIMWSECSSPEETRKSLAFCKANPERWTSQSRDGRVIEIIERQRYGICPCCGREVFFYGNGYVSAFECECGKWYNQFGQEILPPKAWEYVDEPIEQEPEF